MVETEWPELRGVEVEYGDHTLELTGMVDVRGTGESLEVNAKQIGDVRGNEVGLRFGIETPPASLNPGNLGEHFDEIKREGNQYYLLVKKEPTVYRYQLHGIKR